MASIGDRIAQARASKGLSQAEVGAACSPPVSGQAVYKWEKNKSAASAKNLNVIAQLTGRSLKWLLTGVENIPNDGSLGYQPTDAGGAVVSVDSNDVNQFLSGDRSVIRGSVRSNFQCSASSFQTFIKDDSNAPDLVPGDSIIIDPERKPRPGKLCLAVYEGEAIVRRYRPRGDQVELAPINGDWPAVTVPADAVVGAITEITKPH